VERAGEFLALKAAGGEETDRAGEFLGEFLAKKAEGGEDMDLEGIGTGEDDTEGEGLRRVVGDGGEETERKEEAVLGGTEENAVLGGAKKGRGDARGGGRGEGSRFCGGKGDDLSNLPSCQMFKWTLKTVLLPRKLPMPNRPVDCSSTH